MATKKIHTTLDVEKIYCTVTCPECSGTVKMKMRGPVTRKTCPKCNRCSYVFTITPMRGYISVTVLTIGHNETPTEYAIGSEDIEIDEDNNNQPIMEE